MATIEAVDARSVDGGVNLDVRVQMFESENGLKAPEAAVYAFSAGGHLLDTQPLDGKASARLSFPATREPQGVRLLVGPVIETAGVGIEELQRRGAVEQQLRIEPGKTAEQAQIDVFPGEWGCWLYGLCFVPGTLLKRDISGGVPIDLPVCQATVEVYEVDPFPIIIQNLPDPVIEHLRELILNPHLVKPGVGPFPPGPGPDPGPLMAMAAGPALSEASVRPGMADLQFLAGVSETFAFRQSLIDRAELVRPLICLFYPGFVKIRRIATAKTDDCGHFRAIFFRGCSNSDTPDLYFKATQRLFNFFDVTIYAPTPIGCYTHWNYACGTEVTLYTTSPLARTCRPCPPVIAPDDWVLVAAVGNLPLSRIHGTSQDLQATTDAANLGLTDVGEPFGGLLRFRIEFDNRLRELHDVKYYRVSYRKGAAGAWTPLSSEVHRHYTHVVGGDLVLEVLSLGPKVVNNVPDLFEIPPALPPLGQYSFPDLYEDLTSAKFPTTVLLPHPNTDFGPYQIKVELFTSAGASANLAALGINFRVPTSTDLSGTIHTSDAAALGLISSNGFVMTLHIDNNVCTADIAAPMRSGVGADDCGVLQYDPDAPGFGDARLRGASPTQLRHLQLQRHAGRDSRGPRRERTRHRRHPLGERHGGRPDREMPRRGVLREPVCRRDGDRRLEPPEPVRRPEGVRLCARSPRAVSRPGASRRRTSGRQSSPVLPPDVTLAIQNRTTERTPLPGMAGESNRRCPPNCTTSA